MKEVKRKRRNFPSTTTEDGNHYDIDLDFLCSGIP